MRGILLVLLYLFAFVTSLRYSKQSAVITQAQSSSHRNTFSGNGQVDNKQSKTLAKTSMSNVDYVSNIIPSRGIVDYIGKTDIPTLSTAKPRSKFGTYEPTTGLKLFLTKFALWRQLPWKKIRGKAVITISIGGDIMLEEPQRSFFSGGGDENVIVSLEQADRLLRFAAHDPRIKAVLIDINPLACGYAKVTELRRSMEYFKQSGKDLIGYCTTGSEKELFLSLSCSSIYTPPDGGFDLRGFSSSATFVRGLLEKIGIEPQVQRIGKYKSFGDTINRYNISDAQREVVSSLIMEASNNWIHEVSNCRNISRESVMELWTYDERVSPEILKAKGIITGVSYKDQVLDSVRMKYSTYGAYANYIKSKNNISDEELGVELRDYDLSSEFILQPRRSLAQSTQNTSVTNNATTVSESLVEMQPTGDKVDDVSASINVDDKKRKDIINLLKTRSRKPSLLPGGRYLRKMRKGDRILQGLPIQQARSGPRIAIINAVGGINTGKSSNGANGRSLGSDSLIALIVAAREDPSIKGVVIRVDSPGGSALASDLMWREVRKLSAVKPVVASQVDVAASGGYYISMACDHIVGEELTVTGSIGVVLAKFNAKKLNEKLGLVVENISRGKFAEVLSTSRGFTSEEDEYFSRLANESYKSFVTKAAASRNMTYDAMHEVAQGRVWTGKQAKAVGLVDSIGGLTKSLEIVSEMANMTTKRGAPLRFEVLRDRTGGVPFPLSSLGATASSDSNFVQAVCDSSIFDTELVSPESVGCGLSVLRNSGIPASLRYELISMMGRDVVEALMQTKLISNGEFSMVSLSTLVEYMVEAFDL